MLNSVQLQGRLTFDNELKTTQGGTSVLSNKIAVERNTADRQADFIPFTAFGKTAELIDRFINKGDMFIIEGVVKVDTWTDKETGKQRNSVYVVANRMQFCGGRKDSNSVDVERGYTDDEPQAVKSYGTADDFAPIYSDDDLPF